LKPATGTAGAWIVAPQLLEEFFLAVHDAEAAFDVGFGREAAPAFATAFAEKSLLSICVSLPYLPPLFGADSRYGTGSNSDRVSIGVGTCGVT
jgi:hypothetical protein